MGSEAGAKAPVQDRRDHLFVVTAAALNGVSGLLVIVLAARSLSVAEAADFMVFWGALFAAYGVLGGTSAETTRAIRSDAAPDGAEGTSVIRVVLGLTLVAATGVAVTAPLWAGHLFGGSSLVWTVLLLAGLVLFAFHCVFVGVAAGRGHWRRYAFLVGVEPVTRLLLAAAAVLAAAGETGLATASALASGYWLVLVALRRRGLGWEARVALEWRGFVSRLVSACSAAAASAVLVVGFPVLVRATTPDTAFAAAAPLLLAVSLCRAPLMVPLGVYQNVVVAHVITRGLGALRVPVLLIGAVTLVGMGASAVVGPWALRVVNPDYHVGRGTFAALVLAAGLMCVITLTGAAALAWDRHHLYVAGWVVASAVAVGVLLTPYDLTPRACVALVVGPVVGIVLHLSLLLTGSRRRPLTEAASLQ